MDEKTVSWKFHDGVRVEDVKNFCDVFKKAYKANMLANGVGKDFVRCLNLLFTFQVIKIND